MNIRLMMLFSTVPRNVLMPNTSAQSSLVRDEAIWNLPAHGNAASHQHHTRENIRCREQKLQKWVVALIADDAKLYRRHH